jgi:cell division protein FtsN
MASSMGQPLMRSAALALVAALLGVASAFLVACGDRNDLIPKDDAAAIESNLDQASALYSREECRAAQAQIAEAQARASRLPSSVNGDLRTTLEQNIQIVLRRVQEQCGRTQTTQTTQTTQPTVTETVPTETTPTETQPPTTTTQPPPPTTTTAPSPPPAGGGGSGNGSGGTPGPGAGGSGGAGTG